MMNPGFNFAIAFTMWQESYQDKAVDLGDGAGLTKYGITAKHHPGVNIETLTLPEAIAIYERNYWTAINAGLVAIPLGVALFDAAVNHGQPTAVTLLQRAVGVKEDGVLGPVTAAAARNVPRALRRFCILRDKRYHEHPRFADYGDHWIERLLESYAYCLGLPD